MLGAMYTVLLILVDVMAETATVRVPAVVDVHFQSVHSQQN